jgi:hypothetical protein
MAGTLRRARNETVAANVYLALSAPATIAPRAQPPE